MNQDRSRRLLKGLGFGLGVLLFVAAVVVAVTGDEASLRSVIDSVSAAPAWLFALALLLPVMNLVVVAASFCVLTRRFSRVPLGEMSALVGSAWLLNFLPLRPGMIGRLAYHKRVHGIRVRDSARVLIECTVMTVLAAVLVLIAAFLPTPGSLFGGEAGLWLAVAPGVLTAGAGLVWASRRMVLVAYALRHLDLLIWVARYAVVFEMVGEPIGFQGAALVAGISQLALLVPIAGNGLGVREWSVGAIYRASGLQADILNRGFEILVAVPLGLVCAAYLARRVRSQRPSTDDHDATPDTESP